MATLEIKREFDPNPMGPCSNASNINCQSNFSDDENSYADENVESLTMSAKSKLKRKRISEVTYTAEIAFENYTSATQYVDSLGIWKFERNRPTQKGNKGFFHCKISKDCKSKIYLLTDSLSSKVILYQNSLGHNHEQALDSLGSISEVSHRAKRACLQPMTATTTAVAAAMSTDAESLADENQIVDIVNENDYEDSLVDFNTNDNEEQRDGDDDEEEYSNQTNVHASWYDTTINDTINKSLNNTMGRTEHNYFLEKSFSSRFDADEYLESIYPGVWKFERNRPTKKGSKGFFHCKIARKCKAKIYLLSQTNDSLVALFRNNIEHNHDSNGMMIIGPQSVSQMNKFDETKSNSITNCINNVDQNDTALDADLLDDDDDENNNNQHFHQSFDEGCNQAPKVSTKSLQRRSNAAANRSDVMYTAEETFDNLQMAEEFIKTLAIWRYHRTRDSKIGAKRFYNCRLSKHCKSKIYALCSNSTESVTVFRNNIEHDHTATTDKMSEILANEFYESSSSNNIESGFASVESLVMPKEASENDNSYLSDTENNYGNDNEDMPSPISSTSRTNFHETSKTLPVGINLESYFTPAEKFDNAEEASKHIKLSGEWKYTKSRSSKHGSRNFYNCMGSQTCKSKMYLLLQPNFSQYILFKNNVEHDHDEQKYDSKCQKSLQEKQVEDIGPLKYFTNATSTNNDQHFDDNDEEFNTNGYESSDAALMSENSNSNNLNGPETYSNNSNSSENETNNKQALIGMPSKSISKFSRKDVINHQRQLKQNASLTQRVDYLEKLNKSLLDMLNKERISKQIILSRLEQANNTIEQLKLPQDSKSDLKDTLIKEQESAIERMQKRINELVSEELSSN